MLAPPTSPILHHRGPKRSRLIEQRSGERAGAWKWRISTGRSPPEAPSFRKQRSEGVALKRLDVAHKHAIAHGHTHTCRQPRGLIVIMTLEDKCREAGFNSKNIFELKISARLAPVDEVDGDFMRLAKMNPVQ